MIPIKFHAITRQMIALDGEVLEIFSGLESWRAHVGLIKRIQLQSDRKGNHQLVIESTSGATPIVEAHVSFISFANQGYV